MTCNATLPAIWLTTFIARSIVGFVESLSATRANEDARLVRLIICFSGNSYRLGGKQRDPVPRDVQLCTGAKR
ncbi:hypothetical protein ALP49_101174 [Pseudomonas syringae pv. solidagae]|nr:hypothetical protein ALP49_101174 [Pseudomonas syringae pv. solidagae]